MHLITCLVSYIEFLYCFHKQTGHYNSRKMFQLLSWLESSNGWDLTSSTKEVSSGNTKLTAYPIQQQSLKKTKNSLLSAGLENWNTEISKHQKQSSDGDWHASPEAEKEEKDREKEQKEQVNLLQAVRSYVLSHLTIPWQLKQEIYCLLAQIRPKCNFITMLPIQATSLKNKGMQMICAMHSR